MGLGEGVWSESGGQAVRATAGRHSPESVSERSASVRRVCARRGSPRSARRAGVSLQPGLLPPAPLPRARSLLPSPLAPPRQARRWDAPARNKRQRQRRVRGEARAALGARAEPCPRPVAPAPLPSGPRPVKALLLRPPGRRAEQASEPGGREGRAPGRAGRGRRGLGERRPRPAAPPCPSSAAAARRQLGRRQRRLGRQGSRRRTTSGANDELIPFETRARAGAEQRQRVGAAGPGRGSQSSLVNESENQSNPLGLGVRKPRGRPEGPRPGARSPPSPLCLLRRRRGARSPPGTLSRSHGLFCRRYVRVRAVPGSRPRSARRTRLGSRSVPLAPVACSCFSPGRPQPSWGARERRSDSRSHPGTPDQGGVPRAPASPRWFTGGEGPRTARSLRPPYPGYPFLMIPDRQPVPPQRTPAPEERAR